MIYVNKLLQSRVNKAQKLLWIRVHFLLADARKFDEMLGDLHDATVMLQQ